MTRVHPARGRLAQFAVLLAVAVILRCDTFGDPNLHGDEVFYHQVGLALHDGVLPYVGVWDRKPFGLFALFYLITAISADPLAYQLVATLFATATAWTIARIAQDWTRPLGGVLAGICYLLWLAPLQGFGGQSPVFYNLFIAVAALLVLRALPRLSAGDRPRSFAAAMLIAGSAITIKTSAAPEAAFLGLIGLAALARSPLNAATVLRSGALWAALGLAPSLAIAAAYWLAGHWPEYWHAMVTANLSKPPTWANLPGRAGIMLALLVPLLIPAVLGLIAQQRERGFVLLWLGAALLGLVAMPNFYIHYALPLLVPLCLAASSFLARPGPGLATTAALALLATTLAPIFQFEHTARSRTANAELTRAIRAHGGKNPLLLLYDAPPQLYRAAGRPFVTPLVFPAHLSHLIERDVSQFSTLDETRRVLALRPGAVAMAAYPRNQPANLETRRLVLAYVGANCRLIRVVNAPERLGDAFIAVWGDCRG